MPFVKLDCGLLDSTLWMDTIARDVFITALLMAEPTEVKEPMGQINVRDLKDTGFTVPIGWYGFVPAAGTGIIHRSGVPLEQGLKALEILGSEDPESRTPAFGGRRMVRVDGGYLILNFIKYREKDATSADRSKRWRERQKLKALSASTRVTDTPTPVIRHQAEAEAEAEAEERNKKERGVAKAPHTPILLKKTIQRFKRPSLEELESYASEIGFNVKAQGFLDYYDARAWKLPGGLLIRDWKAQLRTWQSREEKDGAAQKPKVDYIELNRLVAERRRKEEEEVANRVKS